MIPAPINPTINPGPGVRSLTNTNNTKKKGSGYQSKYNDFVKKYEDIYSQVSNLKNADLSGLDTFGNVFDPFNSDLTGRITRLQRLKDNKSLSGQDARSAAEELKFLQRLQDDVASNIANPYKSYRQRLEGTGGPMIGQITAPGIFDQANPYADQFQSVIGQMSPDKVLGSFNDASNQLRERLSGLANAQRQGVVNESLNRGLGNSGLTLNRLDRVSRDETQAYGQGLSGLASEFERLRQSAGTGAGDLLSRLYSGAEDRLKNKALDAQNYAQLEQQRKIANQNFQLGVGTQASQNLANLLAQLSGSSSGSSGSSSGGSGGSYGNY